MVRNALARNASVLRWLGMEDSTGPTQLQGPCCPSAPVMSSDSVADSHLPRDINLKSLPEAAHLAHSKALGGNGCQAPDSVRVLRPPVSFGLPDRQGFFQETRIFTFSLDAYKQVLKPGWLARFMCGVVGFISLVVFIQLFFLPALPSERSHLAQP